MFGMMPGVQLGLWHSVGPAAAGGAAVIDAEVIRAASTATKYRTASFSHRAGTKFSLLESIAPAGDRLALCAQ